MGVAGVAALLAIATAGAAEPPRPERPHLERWVKLLASPELEGRSGEGGRKTAALITEEYRRLGLEPLFDGQFGQEIPPAPPVEAVGRNVGAILRGADPELKDRFIIVSAHYDHLGVRGGVLYPGADDNASGVAMLLETARSLVESAGKPRRSVVFLAFDQEEVGLYGSRFFAANPPFPIESIDLFLTADMIGRSLGGVCEDLVFVMGTEHIPALRPWLFEEAAGRPLTLGILGADLLILNRSDYGPFRSRKVPFLFFSTGENPRYHAPSDTAETLDYPKLTEISQLIHGVVAKAAVADALPRWSDQVDHPLEEAVTIRDVLRVLDANRAALRINAAQAFVIAGALRTLDGVVERGTVSPAERASIIQAARIVLMTAF
ncbi:M20/M25/M40 family metallo-hydrolase [Planctomyces sp. SH-PL62]|uniref:M20/M25/M40 family metallo-hydrolase n=1 Tax=Planctomyces sp. SH-PL62 TaxID=1636152 RepID=UPI0018D4B719|nr:M20/M25/M40 family metallo-hydrolase [Planctomyces sp. SH-PL62]